MNNQIICKLQVENFRNLENGQIEFGPRINAITGENGNGKTNILEAIHYIINKRSFHKNTSYPQILSTDCGQPEIILKSLFLNKDIEIYYSGKISRDNQLWFLNGKETTKKIPLNSIFIGPFDSLNFYSSPANRRAWFDSHARKINHEYDLTYIKFNKLLKFRNSLLTEKKYKFREQIDAIDIELSLVSFNLTTIKLSLINDINSFSENIFKKLFSEKHKIKLSLKKSIEGENSLELFKQSLSKNIEKDIIIGHTSNGVHKDDYELFFDGLDSQEFCSMGQQKMCYLSLLFAYIELFRYKHIVYPIVLIDDISGELDNKRWEKLIGYLKDREFQVLITTANVLFNSELEKIKDIKRFYVSSGRITSF